MLEIVLTGNIPSKKNSRINTKSGRSFPSKSYQEWHKKASIGLRIDKTIERCESISIVIYFPTMGDADLTNKAESIMDLLVDCGIIRDDNWKVVPVVRLMAEYRKDEGGAKIVISLPSEDA